MRLALIFVWQVVMTAGVVYFDSSSHRWIPGNFALAALLPPFVGYIGAIYNAPLFARRPRALKAGVLTISSVITTIAVYCAVFIIGLKVKGEM